MSDHKKKLAQVKRSQFDDNKVWETYRDLINLANLALRNGVSPINIVLTVPDLRDDFLTAGYSEQEVSP